MGEGQRLSRFYFRQYLTINLGLHPIIHQEHDDVSLSRCFYQSGYLQSICAGLILAFTALIQAHYHRNTAIAQVLSLGMTLAAIS